MQSNAAPAGIRGQSSRRVVSSEVELFKILSHVDDEFLKAFDSAREVSKMLEATRMHYHSNFANNRVGETKGCNIGRKIILPASFVGGPRDMRRRYLDTMALVQKYGKPDIFLTMTCNPNWQEIRENLQFHETPFHRPDLLATVFKARLELLKEQLMTKKIFGEVAACVYVIEFQKCGMPHAHILLIFKNGYKPLNPEAYDRIICSEIPDPEKNPHLYNLVVRHMLHRLIEISKPAKVKSRHDQQRYTIIYCVEEGQTEFSTSENLKSSLLSEKGSQGEMNYTNCMLSENKLPAISISRVKTSLVQRFKMEDTSNDSVPPLQQTQHGAQLSPPPSTNKHAKKPRKV